MVLPLRPLRGGFVRPFGCGWFIREFLLGHGPEGSIEIDPEVGSWQEEIFYYYKMALHRAYAEDAVAWEDEERIRKGKPIYTPEEHEERVAWFLSRMPYKLVNSTSPMLFTSPDYELVVMPMFAGESQKPKGETETAEPVKAEASQPTETTEPAETVSEAEKANAVAEAEAITKADKP